MKCDMQVLIAKCPNSASSRLPIHHLLRHWNTSGQVKKVILRLLQAHPESLTGGTGSHQDEERELKGFAAYLQMFWRLECFKMQ